MDIKLYAIKDTVIGEFSNFFVARNDNDAKRIVRNSFAAHPFVGDWNLYRICFINTVTGDNSSGVCFISTLTDIINGFDETAADPLGDLPKDEVSGIE